MMTRSSIINSLLLLCFILLVCLQHLQVEVEATTVQAVTTTTTTAAATTDGGNHNQLYHGRKESSSVSSSSSQLLLLKSKQRQVEDVFRRLQHQKEEEEDESPQSPQSSAGKVEQEIENLFDELSSSSSSSSLSNEEGTATATETEAEAVIEEVFRRILQQQRTESTSSLGSTFLGNHLREAGVFDNNNSNSNNNGGGGVGESRKGVRGSNGGNGGGKQRGQRSRGNGLAQAPLLYKDQVSAEVLGAIPQSFYYEVKDDAFIDVDQEGRKGGVGDQNKKGGSKMKGSKVEFNWIAAQKDDYDDDANYGNYGLKQKRFKKEKRYKEPHTKKIDHKLMKGGGGSKTKKNSKSSKNFSYDPYAADDDEYRVSEEWNFNSWQWEWVNEETYEEEAEQVNLSSPFNNNQQAKQRRSNNNKHIGGNGGSNVGANGRNSGGNGGSKGGSNGGGNGGSNGGSNGNGDGGYFGNSGGGLGSMTGWKNAEIPGTIAGPITTTTTSRMGPLQNSNNNGYSFGSDLIVGGGDGDGDGDGDGADISTTTPTQWHTYGGGDDRDYFATTVPTQWYTNQNGDAYFLTDATDPVAAGSSASTSSSSGGYFDQQQAVTINVATQPTPNPETGNYRFNFPSIQHQVYSGPIFLKAHSSIDLSQMDPEIFAVLQSVLTPYLQETMGPTLHAYTLEVDYNSPGSGDGDDAAHDVAVREGIIVTKMEVKCAFKVISNSLESFTLIDHKQASRWIHDFFSGPHIYKFMEALRANNILVNDITFVTQQFQVGDVTATQSISAANSQQSLSSSLNGGGGDVIVTKEKNKSNKGGIMVGVTLTVLVVVMLLYLYFTGQLPSCATILQYVPWLGRNRIDDEYGASNKWNNKEGELGELKGFENEHHENEEEGGGGRRLRRTFSGTFRRFPTGGLQHAALQKTPATSEHYLAGGGGGGDTANNQSSSKSVATASSYSSSSNNSATAAALSFFGQQKSKSFDTAVLDDYSFSNVCHSSPSRHEDTTMNAIYSKVAKGVTKAAYLMSPGKNKSASPSMRKSPIPSLAPRRVTASDIASVDEWSIRSYQTTSPSHHPLHREWGSETNTINSSGSGSGGGGSASPKSGRSQDNNNSNNNNNTNSLPVSRKLTIPRFT